MFRDGADKAGQVEPYTTIRPLGSDDPKDLWKVPAGLRGQDRRQGPRDRAQRQPLERHHVPGDRLLHRQADHEGIRARRARGGSRIYEVTQMKGDGEAHPFLSPNDEFAGYEIWDKFNLNMSVPKEDSMLQYEYARTALQIGLQLEAKLGTNPYKFGMIGSTDTHTGLATADEDNFFGKHCRHRAERQAHGAPGRLLRQELPARLVAGRFGLCGRLGDREHARGDLRRDGAQGNLRDHRPAHDRALLRRLGLRRRRCREPPAGRRRLRQGRADGRRPAAPRRPASRRPSSSAR